MKRPSSEKKRQVEAEDLYSPVKRYESAGLHLVKSTDNNRCYKCCLYFDEEECMRFISYCEEGFFMRTTGYTRTYKDIKNN